MMDMNNDETYSKATAAEVRAEMARQNKTQAGLADALKVTAHTASKRMSGEIPFNIVELLAVARWLEVDLLRLLPQQQKAAASA